MVKLTQWRSFAIRRRAAYRQLSFVDGISFK